MDAVYLFILISVISLAASFVQSVTGFGYGIVAMIFLPQLLLYTEANVLSSILSSLTSAVSLWLLRRHVNWKNLIFPLLGSSVSNYFAISFIKTQENDLLMLLLGIALVLLSLYFFLFSGKIKIRSAWYTGLIAGVISGVMGGIFSISGPPVVIYYLQSEKDTDTYVSTISAYFVFSGVLSIGMKAAAGFVTENVLIGLVVGLMGMLIGAALGNMTRHRIKPDAMKKAVYGVMAISGVWNVISSLL